MEGEKSIEMTELSRLREQIERLVWNLDRLNRDNQKLQIRVELLEARLNELKAERVYIQLNFGILNQFSEAKESLKKLEDDELQSLIDLIIKREWGQFNSLVKIWKTYSEEAKRNPSLWVKATIVEDAMVAHLNIVLADADWESSRNAIITQLKRLKEDGIPKELEDILNQPITAFRK